MATGVPARPPGRSAGLVWVVLAIVLGLSVLALNRGPLYYFDSAGYYLQGASILDFVLPDSLQSSSADGVGNADQAVREQDDDASISRSPIYAVVIAAAWIPGALFAVNVLNLIAVFTASWLVARGFLRELEAGPDVLTLTAAPIAFAAVTSLPFYIAYVMPDTFIGIAILLLALIVAFSNNMRPWEIFLAFALLAFAVLVHRSHLLIVGMIVPFAVVGAFVASGRRGWIPAGLAIVAVVIGFAEIKAYSFAAEKVAGKAAIIPPFLTARIIEDGPGYDYLQENCPEIELDTCALAEALSWSDDPWRLTASHIAFETSEQLGSYLLMTPEDQHKVTWEQREFYMRVFADRPVEVIRSILINTLRQATNFSVEMTVPDDNTIKMVRRLTGFAELDAGPLADSRTWIKTADRIHASIYVVSLGAILVVFFMPNALTRRMRVFTALVIIGILVNAFVCGAASQPAARYGARVVWLLPYLAVLLTIIAINQRATQTEGDTV